MYETPRLAGYFTAHGIWSVSDGETLIPIYGCLTEEGQPVLNRMAAETFEQGVAEGEKMLESNPQSAKCGVLIYDGRINLPEGKYDALFIKMRTYDSEAPFSMLAAIPYSPKRLLKKFRVHRPKILELPDQFHDKTNEIFEAFFEGVDSHEKGSEIWNSSADDSV
ncbi:MAG: hypothetical protein Alis3KO_41220 [Aliiglaciecola sp.]